MNAAPEKVCDCGGAIDCERCAERERVEAEQRSAIPYVKFRATRRSRTGVALVAAKKQEATPEMPPLPKLAGIQENLFEGPTQPGRLSPAAAKRFILAGAATFTLRSGKTGVRYTYKVTEIPNQEGRSLLWGRKYWVSLLTGPDNTGDFTYLGMIEGTRFRLTGKSKMPATAAPVRAIEYASRHILNHGEIPAQLEFWHEGRCGMCGKPLTVPESIACGLGPVCAGKVGL